MTETKSLSIKCTESVGFDCLHHKNLHFLPKSNLYPPTLALISGTSVVFRSIGSDEEIRPPLNFESTSVNCLTDSVHPSGKLFAVGERKHKTDLEKPKIRIFSWPECEESHVLEGSAEKAVSYLTFSPSGVGYDQELLASVGTSPDFTLTLWNWKNSKIMLRSKAYGQDVFSVFFNPFIKGQLCSSGVGHIKFWQMARTFTGLKLQGELGRFGRTAISDVEAFVQLPDGRILSGSEWGNLLLWDGGLISLEVTQPNKTCHEGSIRCIFLDESGELMTAGADGAIRIWNAEAILEVDAGTLEDGLFKIEFMNEMQISHNGQMSDIIDMVKYDDGKEKSEDEEDEEDFWLAQDSKGAIWKLDLSFSHKAKQPVRIKTSHSGVVNSVAVNEISERVASAGDNIIRLYEMSVGEQKTKLILEASVISPAKSMLWMGRRHLIVGHQDGVVRTYAYTIDVGRENKLVVRQAIKPHIKCIDEIYSLQNGKYILTRSQDETIFIYKCLGAEEEYKLQPIGFIETIGVPTCVTFNTENFCLIIGTSKSQISVYDLTPITTIDLSAERTTYNLCLQPTHDINFKSCKDQLVRDNAKAIYDKKTAEFLATKNKQLKARKDAGEEFSKEQEEEFLHVEPFEIDESPLHVPSEPSSITSIWPADEDNSELIFSMSGYDNGVLYHIKTKNGSLLSSKFIEIEDDITACVRESGTVIIGTKTGGVYIYQSVGMLLLPSEFEKYELKFQQHDYLHGSISKICPFGINQLFTSGLDGNLFRYTVEGGPTRGLPIPRPVSQRAFFPVKDIESKDAWSLEQAREKLQEQRENKLAEKRRELRQKRLEELQTEYEQLKIRNDKLPDLAKVDGVEKADQICSPEMEAAGKSEGQLNVVLQNLLPTTVEREAVTFKKENYFLSNLVHDTSRLWDFGMQNSVENYKLKELFDSDYKKEYARVRSCIKTRQSNIDSQDEAETDNSDATENSSVIGRVFLFVNSKNIFFLLSLGTCKFLFQILNKTLFMGLLRQSDLRRRSKHGRRDTIHRHSSVIIDFSKMTKEEQSAYKRQLRSEEWEQLNADKPDLTRADPRDEAEIEDAKRNLGDLKLKTSDDYIVPEEQRANADQKRLQLMDKESEFYKKCYQFNHYVDTLIKKKLKIRDEIFKSRQRLIVIHKEIEQEHRKPLPEVPEIQISEEPAKKYIPTVEDIQSELAKVTSTGKILSVAPPSTGGSTEKLEQSASIFPTAEQRPLINLMGNRTTWPEARKKSLLLEQDEILTEIDAKKEEFNQDVKKAAFLKALVEVHLYAGRLSADTLSQESWLLEKFEAREQALELKVQARIKELHDIKKQRSETEKKFEERQVELKGKNIQQKNLEETFTTLLPDNAKASEWLTKVFKKKIKRKKEKVKTENQDSDSEEESSDDSDSDLSDDDENESGSENGSVFDENVKPMQIDDSTLERALGMRNSRVDLEEEISEIKKSMDLHKKEVENLGKKVKSFEGQLKSARMDSEKLQQEKQKELNLVWVSVPLFLKNINQKLIQVPVKSKSKPEWRSELPTPKVQNECLVLPLNTITKLERRIIELEKEQETQKKLQEASRHQRKGEMEQRCKFLDEQAKQLMELRFGRVLDIHALQEQTSVLSSRGIDELLKRIRDVEAQIAIDHRDWNEKIARQKERLTAITKENTEYLRQLDDLNAEQQRLELELDTRQAGETKEGLQRKHPQEYLTGGGDIRQREEEKKETLNLKNLISQQTEKIHQLSSEIEILSRKGGSIPPPQ